MNATRDRDLSVLAVGVDPGALEGCTVETADDLLGALAHLAGGGIDVVVASLNLPDASGTDVIVSLRERAPEVPVIVVGDAEAEPSEAFGAGASDVLPPDAAADLVARAIRYAATLRKVEAGLRRYQAFDELTGIVEREGIRPAREPSLPSGRSFQGPGDHPVPPGGSRRRSPRRPRGRRCRDGDQLGRARDRRRRPCRVRCVPRVARGGVHRDGADRPREDRRRRWPPTMPMRVAIPGRRSRWERRPTTPSIRSRLRA